MTWGTFAFVSIHGCDIIQMDGAAQELHFLFWIVQVPWGFFLRFYSLAVLVSTFLKSPHHWYSRVCLKMYYVIWIQLMKLFWTLTPHTLVTTFEWVCLKRKWTICAKKNPIKSVKVYILPRSIRRLFVFIHSKRFRQLWSGTSLPDNNQRSTQKWKNALSPELLLGASV